MRKYQIWKGLAMGITLATMVTITTAYHCPSDCKCISKYKSVYCEHLNLQNVPKGIPNDTTGLYIGYNSITELKVGDFASLPNLAVLSLKQNKLIKIQDGTFKANTKLATIYLTNNILSDLSAETFQGLSSLQNLYLTNNKLYAIPDLKYAVSLKKLNLDTNKITDPTFPAGYQQLKSLGQVNLAVNPNIKEIKNISFQNLGDASVTKINLNRCGINKIGTDSFTPLSSLVSLKIGYNQINQSQVSGFIKGLAGSHITSLDMSGVFQNLPYLANATFSVLSDLRLLQLKLAHSVINVLQDYCFEGLSKLELLDLSYAKITAAQPQAFHGLDSLKTLKIYHNRFAVIPSNLPSSLQSLDISHNSDIDELPDTKFINLQNLLELKIHHCSIVQVHGKALWGIGKLLTLDLSHNQIGGNNIGVKVMQDLHQLSSLYLQGNKLTTINKETNLFVGLKNLTLLDMSDSSCSFLSDGLFHPLKKLKTLKLSGNALGPQLAADTDGSTFEGLHNLKELYIENNGLSTLPAALFKDLGMLRNLSLKSNRLYHWESQLFQPLKNIGLADFSMNQISIINETSWSFDRPSMKLNLTANPFNCGCDLVWFRRWVSSNNQTLLNLSNYTCKSPTKMEGKRLTDFNPDAIWTACHWLEILYICIGIVFVMTVASACVLYRYRWKIMVHYYFARHYLRVLQRTRQSEGDVSQLVVQSPEYDAILSSEDEEKDFVDHFLLPNICTKYKDEGAQNVRHNICYPSVEIEGGTHMAEFAAMAQPDKSNKMIVVLSEKYMLNLEKFDFELGVARRRIQNEGRGIIIIIFIGPPELHAKAPFDIRMLLNDDKLTLRWDRKWEKAPERHKDAIKVFYQNVKDMLDKPNPHSSIQV